MLFHLSLKMRTAVMVSAPHLLRSAPPTMSSQDHNDIVGGGKLLRTMHTRYEVRKERDNSY